MRRGRPALKTLLLALSLDALLGEPPSRLHPVVLMGHMLDLLERRAPHNDAARMAYGVVVALGLPTIWGVAGWLVETVVPWPGQAGALKAAFAGRSLHDAAQRVEDDLRGGQLDQAREHVRWLVSRPTENLDSGLIASAAIESLAENYTDSWLAPLAAYALFGLGGAYFYRAANTADAMWGYRTPQYEWLGKAVARFDDVLNWLPARIAALLLIAVGPQGLAALRVWSRDGGLTSSPNAGQTMAVAAGHLGVRLEKPEHYVLYAEARAPSTQDIAAGRRMVARGMLLAAALSLVVCRLVRR